MNRRELLQKLGGVLAVAGVVAVTTKEKVLAQGGDCTTEQFTRPQTGYYYSHCSQQWIRYTVTVQQTVQTCTNADGSVTYKIHEQLHGTGQSYDPATHQLTGAEYVLNDQIHEREIFGPYTGSGCTPSSHTTIQHLVLVSKGNAPNENTVWTITDSVDSSCHIQSSYNMDTDCHG